MKKIYLLPFIISLSLSSIPALAQADNNAESTSKSLIQCHNVLFALAVFSKLPITHEENALIEKIKTAIPRITTKNDTLRLFELVAIENHDLMAEITSESLSASRAQELKNKFSASCTPELLFAESLPDVR